MDPSEIVTEFDASEYNDAIDCMNAALGELEESERPVQQRGRFLVCVDFDGVLNSYTSGWTGDACHCPDAPVEGAIAWLEDCVRNEKLEVCVYSSRSRYAGGPEAIGRWLLQHGFDVGLFPTIWFPTRKPPASILIDDRAFLFEGTFPSAETLLAFKPWNKR
jgi:hypothetical protein